MSPQTYFEFCIKLVLLNIAYRTMGHEPVDTTTGFELVPFNGSNIYFHILKPYDVPVEQRYSFINGVHRLWVLNTDKPHSKTSITKPRTEIGIQPNFSSGIWQNYYTGVWQFEAYGYVPCGTSGVCIMQVFGANPPRATTAMLRVYNDSLYYYRNPVIIPHVYDKWFRLNVIHDVECNNVKVYIDGVLKHEAQGRGGKSHSFHCGVYAQDGDTFYMESRWKDIKIYKKN